MKNKGKHIGYVVRLDDKSDPVSFFGGTLKTAVVFSLSYAYAQAAVEARKYPGTKVFALYERARSHRVRIPVIEALKKPERSLAICNQATGLYTGNPFISGIGFREGYDLNHDEVILYHTVLEANLAIEEAAISRRRADGNYFIVGVDHIEVSERVIVNL